MYSEPRERHLVTKMRNSILKKNAEKENNTESLFSGELSKKKRFTKMSCLKDCEVVIFAFEKVSALLAVKIPTFGWLH